MPYGYHIRFTFNRPNARSIIYHNRTRLAFPKPSTGGIYHGYTSVPETSHQKDQDKAATQDFEMYNAADLFLPFPHPPISAGSSSSTPGSGSVSGAKKGKQNKANANVNGNANTESPYGSRAGSPAGTPGPTEVFDSARSTSTSGLVKATRWAEEKYWRALPGGREEKEAKRGLVAQAGYRELHFLL
jgi:hypothetical protein